MLEQRIMVVYAQVVVIYNHFPPVIDAAPLNTLSSHNILYISMMVDVPTDIKTWHRECVLEREVIKTPGVCPDKAIELSDSQNYYEWTYDPGRCTFCEHCYTYCPVSALSMEPEPALAYKRRYELKQIHKMDYPICPEYGQIALPVSEELLVQTFGQITGEMRGWIHLCERCRRRRYQLILKINAQGKNQSNGS